MRGHGARPLDDGVARKADGEGALRLEGLAVVVEPGVGKRHVLFGEGHPQVVEAAVAHHTVEGGDHAGVGVLLFAGRFQGRGAADDLVVLRGVFLEAADGRLVAVVDLEVELQQQVPEQVVLGGHEREIRAGLEGAGDSLLRGQPFHAGEEVEPVPDDRSADHAADGLEAQVRLVLIVALGEEVLRVEARVLQVVENGAADTVRSALRDGVDHAALGTSELGVELGGEDLELLDRLDRGTRLRSGAPTDDVVVVVRPVHVERVVVVVLAVHEDGVGGGGGGGHVGHHTGDQAGKVDEAAGLRRERLHGFGSHRGANLLRGHVHHRRLGGDHHRLLDAPEFQGDVQTGLLPHHELEPVLTDRTECREFEAQVVGAGSQPVQDVAPVARSGNHPGGAGIGVGRGDRDAGKREPARVGDRTGKTGARKLGVGSRDSEERPGGKGESGKAGATPDPWIRHTNTSRRQKDKKRETRLCQSCFSATGLTSRHPWCLAWQNPRERWLAAGGFAVVRCPSRMASHRPEP